MIIKERMKIYLEKLIESQLMLTSSQLAQLAKVTVRTVKADIRELNDFLKDYGAQIEAKKGQGYHLTIRDEVQFQQLRVYLKNYDAPNAQQFQNTQKNRIEYMIRKLLVVDYPIKMDEIEEEIYVSKSTLSREIKIVKKILQHYNLKIEAVPRYGMIIAGGEMDRRLCIAEYFFQSFSNDFYALNNPMMTSKNSKREIIFLQNALIKVANERRLRFSDQTIQNIVIHVYIALKRCTINQFVQFEETVKSRYQASREYPAACEFAEMLEKQLNVRIPDQERIYYTMLIQSKQILENQTVDEERYSAFLDALFIRIQKKFHVDFAGQETLRRYLLMHIPPMIERLRNHMIMRNPMRHDVLQNYLLATMITLEAAQWIEEYFDVRMDDNEFGYLVLYFNVALNDGNPRRTLNLKLICGRGRPESIVLLNDLQEMFKGMIGTIEILDIQQLKTVEPEDLLITTMPLAEIPNSNHYLYVAGNIRNYYDKIRQILVLAQFDRIQIEDYLSPAFFFTNLHVSDQQECLRQIQRKLAENLGEEAAGLFFKQHIKTANELGNNVIFLHSAYESPRPFLSFVILTKPILWNREYGQIIILNQCTAAGLEVSRSLCKILTEWMTEKNIQDLIKKPNYENLRKQLQDTEHLKVGGSFG